MFSVNLSQKILVGCHILKSLASLLLIHLKQGQAHMKYDRRRAACEDCNTSAKKKKKADHSEDSESDIKSSLRFP